MIQQEIHVKVSFIKHTLTKKDSGVVQGDYNTTKMVFEFEEDMTNRNILFEMSSPQGELVLLKDLSEDNEVVLVGYDEEGKACSLFNQTGLYPFELVIYGEDSKLTSAPGYLTVNKQLVQIEDAEVELYIPFFDDLMGEVGDLRQQIEAMSGDIDKAVQDYLDAHPVTPGATEEQAQQIEANRTSIETMQEELDNKLSSDTLQSSIDHALKIAKDSGEFDGAEGEPGAGAIWWRGLPETIDVPCLADGTIKEDSLTYTVNLMQGENVVPLAGFYTGMSGNSNCAFVQFSIAGDDLNITINFVDKLLQTLNRWDMDVQLYSIKINDAGEQVVDQLYRKKVPLVFIRDGIQGIQGIQGVQGVQGKPFSIAKTYATIDEMNADFNNSDIESGSFVCIVSSVNTEDNAKLFCKGETEYTFIVDMSGMTGMQGEQGVQGVQGIQGEAGYTPKRGTDYYTEADKNEMVNLVLAALPTWTGGSF